MLPAPGGAGGSTGGAPQSRWDPGGSSCSVPALQLSCSATRTRRGKCCASRVPAYFTLTKLGGGGGSWIQVSHCSPSSGYVPLLSYPLTPLCNFLAAVPHGVLFFTPFQAVQEHKRAFVVAGVPYLYAVRSITAAARVRGSALGDASEGCWVSGTL